MADDPGVRRLMAGDGASTLVRPAAATPPAPVAAAEPVVLTPAGGRGPLSGQAWQDFLIGDLIAAGGMGEVYRAVQRPMGRVVALKVLPTGAAVEHLVRFAAEARAAAQLHHPHVVAVHASGERDGSPFLAMEFAEGGSLAGLVERQRAAGAPLTPFAAADLAWQAADGLAAAHAAGLVHRDLKPANLLLMADGTLKVADFGLVRFLDAHQHTVAGTVLGTPLYMAPEQGRGLPAGPAADIYSLGCVLYELLTLQPPFAGDSSEALVMQH
ncbi:MAG: serine/threonine protein kinase, partial [Planctomycetes bacterium]|nr:serine/threonine protein kinase [Planctomycetota bacterium]